MAEILTSIDKPTSNFDKERLMSVFNNKEAPWLTLKDRKTVQNLLGKIEHLQVEERGKYYDALSVVVPRVDENGEVWIGNTRINKGFQKLIESRRNAPDMPSQFSSAPDDYKERVINTNPWIEFTKRCTVGCTFCGISDKGDIKGRIPFNEALEDVSMIIKAGKTAHFYFASDPFDARWSDDRDISDLIIALGKHKGRKYVIITGVPVGEELRILRTSSILHKNHLDEYMELSERPENSERVNAIYRLSKLIKSNIYVRNSGKSPYLTNKAFTSSNDVSVNDLIGPVCGDLNVITPGGMDIIMNVVTTDSHPNGIIRQPAVETKVNGDKVYKYLPYSQERPRIFSNKGIEYLAGPIVYSAVYQPNGEVKYLTEQNLTDNPFRSMFRLVATLKSLYNWNEIRKKPENWYSDAGTYAYSDGTSGFFSRRDLSNVIDYLHNNPGKDRWMKFYIDKLQSSFPTDGYYWQD